MKKNQIKESKIVLVPETKRRLMLALAIFLTILGSLILLFSLYSFSYANKIYPNVQVAGINLGGKNQEEAKKMLDDKISKVKDQEITFNSQEFSKKVSPQEFTIDYNVAATVKSAYLIGRSGGIFAKFTDKIKLLFIPERQLTAFSYNVNSYEQVSDEARTKINKLVQDASCKIENKEIIVVPEQKGQNIEITKLQNNFQKAIGNLETNRQVDIPIVGLEPKITSAQVNLAKEQTQKLLTDKFSLEFTADKKMDLNLETVIPWLEFVAQKNENNQNFNLNLAINNEKIRSFVAKIADEIHQDPVDAKLTIADGRATVWQKSQTGYELNRDEAIKVIANSLMKRAGVAGVNSAGDLAANLIINLPTKITKPDISEDQIDNLGIKELIAKGTTNFAKSPTNRRHNIALGASMFYGVIIKPGEEFSFLKYLGRVTESRGFLKELVIKENKTEPEVGGGLCQVSTTMFRAALNAGLEITDRTNHKYRVSYYEPPVGLDATVYEPSPDLKFINDTPGHILIQGSVSGDSITFEFYGTKDGRDVSISNPEIYDYSSPGEPVYIDDPSLGPGETKYKEKAHQGAKAKISYTVKKDGKIMRQQTFYSTYVAWQAVILRGPGGDSGATSQPQPESTPSQPQPENTSTPTPSPTPTPSSSPSSSASPT